MKTAQTKARLMKQAMLRRIVVGLTFGIALGFSAFGSVTRMPGCCSTKLEVSMK